MKFQKDDHFATNCLETRPRIHFRIVPEMDSKHNFASIALKLSCSNFANSSTFSIELKPFNSLVTVTEKTASFAWHNQWFYTFINLSLIFGARKSNNLLPGTA